MPTHSTRKCNAESSHMILFHLFSESFLALEIHRTPTEFRIPLKPCYWIDASTGAAGSSGTRYSDNYGSMLHQHIMHPAAAVRQVGVPGLQRGAAQLSGRSGRCPARRIALSRFLTQSCLLLRTIRLAPLSVVIPGPARGGGSRTSSSGQHLPKRNATRASTFVDA